MAVSYWHLSIEPVGLSHDDVAIGQCISIAFFWRGWMNGRTRDYGWSGVWFAVSLYTYVAARLLPLVVVLFVLSELGLDLLRLRQNSLFCGSEWRPRLKGLGLMALVAFLLIAPLLWVFWTNPELISARTADISVFTASLSAYMSGTPLQRIIHNVGAVAGSFYIGGDQNAATTCPIDLSTTYFWRSFSQSAGWPRSFASRSHTHG